MQILVQINSSLILLSRDIWFGEFEVIGRPKKPLPVVSFVITALISESSRGIIGKRRSYVGTKDFLNPRDGFF